MKKKKLACICLLTGAITFGTLYFSMLIAIPKFVDLNKYKDNVAVEIEKQTGFKVSCENISFKKSLTPYFNVNLYHTAVFYPNNELFLQLKEIDLKVKILPLLLKKIEIKDAKFTRPIINITLYEDFSTSLEKYIKKEENLNTNGFKMNSIIYDTIFENYKIKINDKTINKQFYIEGENLLLKNMKIGENAHIIAKGALFQDNKRYLNYDLNLKTILTEKKQFTFSPFKPIYEYNVTGDVKGNLQVLKNNNLNGEIKINNLSVNLGNENLDKNNINLNFKGDNVVIASELHTSKNDIAKLDGTFNFGKNKHIDVNTNAKNINLENLFKLLSITLESLNIENKLKDLNIQGYANANFNLNSDFKTLKSKGIGQLINAKVTHKKLPYTIDKINSEINFNDNKITINKAQVHINDTPINISGFLNENVNINLNATANNLNLKTIQEIFFKKLDLPVNIEKGTLSFNSKITGNLQNGLETINSISLSNLELIEKTTNTPISIYNSNIDLKTNKMQYWGNINCNNLLSKLNQNGFVTAETLNLNFNTKEINIPSNQIRINHSPLYIQGNIENPLKNPIAHIKFESKIQAKELAKIISEHINIPYKAIGEIKTQGIITTKNNNTKIKMNMYADKENYISYLVIKELLNKPSILNLEGELNNNIFSIKDLSIFENVQTQNQQQKTIAITGQIITGKNPLFKDLRINIPENITVFTNFLGGEELSFTSNLMLSNTIKNPSIKGNAKISKYNIRNLLTSIKNADINFSPDNIRIIAPDIMMNTSRINAIIDINPVFNKELKITNMQLNCFSLDLNTLFPLLQNIKKPSSNSLITIENGIATINKFNVIDLKANDISADFSLHNEKLKINNISALGYGGSLEGNLDYDFPDSNLIVNINGKNTNLKNLLFDLCKIEDNIEGKTDFSTNVSIKLGKYEDVIKSLTGKIDFNASNGKMGTLGKFEYYLSAQNILYHGLLNTTLNRIADIINKDKTQNFRKAYGSIFFQNGYLITNDVKTIGENMSLYIKGKHNMLTNKVNIDIYGRISDEIKNQLGSFGDVSIHDLLNNTQNRKKHTAIQLPSHIIDKIPNLYNQQESEKTNTFRVTIFGDINSLSAINSFEWIIPYIVEKNTESLPDFSDITIQNL